MDDSELLAQGFRCYAQLKVVDYMKDSYHELRALDSIHMYRLSMTWKNLGWELKALDAMNSLVLWLTWKTPGCELKALDTMNN